MSRSTRSNGPERGRDARSTTPAARFAAALIAVCSAADAAATVIEAPAHVRRYVEQARPAGNGKLTWFGFHVYDATLFAAPGFDPADPFRQKFVLELTYARRLDGKDIADASRDEIRRLGFGSDDQRTRWHAQMLELFPNVDRGRRLAGANLPGGGANFYFDGRFIGSIDDPQFARAFFSIWLDERTRAPQLRASLLGAPAGARPGTD